jgi:hypothetical protein
MARAHLFRPVTDQQGNLLYNATVTVRETNYAVEVGQALYSSATGSDTLPNPFTVSNGVIDFWLNTPQRVSLLVQSDGNQDILAYLDAQPSPDQIVTSTAPLTVINSPSASGQVLLSTAVPSQVQWGAAPGGTGLTPIVVTSSQSWASGADPAGWTFTGTNSIHGYDPITIPPGTNYTYSLHGTVTAASGTLTVTGPTFTLLEAGNLSLWAKSSIQSGGSLAFRVTDPGSVTTVLGTISETRDWGFYSYSLAAGTYTPTFVYTGASAFSGAAHDVWLTGYVARYGGNVPAHTHSGSGASSVALGTSSVASAQFATAVGATAQATGTNSTAYGYNAHATGNSTLAVGTNAVAGTDYSLAVGAGATGATAPASTAWTAVGYNASAQGLEAIAVGKNASATADYGTAVGSGAQVTAASAVAIGQGASAQAASGIAIGQSAVVGATHINSVALGSGATTTGSNQIVLGNPGAMTIIPGSLQNYGLVSLGAQGSRVGFYGSTGNVQQIVGGSDDGNVTLRTLTTALANMNLIINQSIQQPSQFASPVGPIDFFYHQDPADGSLGNADFDYRPYVYAPLAFSSNTPYPAGPQWYVGTDHNAYKGLSTGLGVLKNMYTPRQSFSIGIQVAPASTGNHYCFALRHTGQTDSSAAAGYLILDQDANTISLAVKAAGALSNVYTVAAGNSLSLASTPYTLFDGSQHTCTVVVSASTVMFSDTLPPNQVPVFFYDPALNPNGTYVGVDINNTTAKLNNVVFLPQQSFDNFRTTGALVNAPSGEAWWPINSGAGSGTTVSAAGNLQVTGVAAGYSLNYILTNANTNQKVVRTRWATGTTPSTAMGVVLRYVDPNNYFFCNGSQITRVLSGTQTTLATYSTAMVAGDYMTITHSSAGIIQVLRNGAPVASVTDTTSTLLASSRFGLGVRGAAVANFSWFWVSDTYNSGVIYK